MPNLDSLGHGLDWFSGFIFTLCSLPARVLGSCCWLWARRAGWVGLMVLLGFLVGRKGGSSWLMLLMWFLWGPAGRGRAPALLLIVEVVARYL